MHPSVFGQMLEHVRTIHRIVVGDEVPERETSTDDAALTTEQVARKFGELELLARSLPVVAERLAPFSFAPPVDVMVTEREVIIEVGVPGVEEDDVQAELSGETLIVSGSLGGAPDKGRTYHHAEMPRGPFSRVVPLPCAVASKPRLEVLNGVIRIRLAKRVKTVPAKA